MSNTLAMMSRAQAAELWQDSTAARAHALQRLCEDSRDFLELVADCCGKLLYLNDTLAHKLSVDAESQSSLWLDQLIGAARYEYLIAQQSSGAVQWVEFVSQTGMVFTARVRLLEESGKIRLIGLFSSLVDDRELYEIHAINNQLAVTSRELYRQHRQLETTLANTRSSEADLRVACQFAEVSAKTDPLTGLFNRRAFTEDVPRLLAQAEGKCVSTLLLDLDHFKQINDHFGHEKGDQVLKAVAQVLLRRCRDTDIAIRMGGEEFVVVLPGVNLEKAYILATRMRQSISAIRLRGVTWRITASIGVATWQGSQESAEALLARSDAAMYRAKSEGRDRCAVAN